MSTPLILKGSYYGINYDFSLYTDHIILGGDSSTGKTLMFNILRDHESSLHNILAIDTKNSFERDLDNAVKDPTTLIVLDRVDYWAEENHIDRLEDMIHDTENKFIIVSRRYGFMLPISARRRLVFKNDILQFE